ncbi:hypothetical protein SAMN02927921_01578 [Sinomicrobium oceani]|uniref:50S ribosomal protein L27 n=1 Tax=Sinomicrobium oceani TaxID=1150368 RepID=A0A1K1P2H9_9FLAO|nr:hypothetical protein [Sinomicrobium oceani]SFW41780.1 hypothetical protein SAMN02927921_01578 [Sinomicrobium oceani]
MGIIQTLHSYWAYLTLIMLVIAVINAIIGYFSSKPFIIGKDLRISLFALIFTHIQLLLGIVLYFVSDRFSLWSELGPGGVMKNDLARLLLVEHPFTNILAIILITIGWSKHKKVESAKGKFGKIAFFYTIGLILLLSRIPWSQWM